MLSNGSSPAGLPLTYQWLFEQPASTTCPGGGLDPACASPGSGAQVSHTWTTSGNFHVQLTATDSTGRSRVDTFAVAIGDVPPTLALNAPTVKDLAATLTGSITHTGPDDVETASVNWGDGGVDTQSIGGPFVTLCIGTCQVSLTAMSSTVVGLSGTHTYATAGKYTITTTVKDQSGGTASRPGP